MTNNPAKYGGLVGHGLRITERVPVHIDPTAQNRRYLQTKRDRMGHDLDLGSAAVAGGEPPTALG
jgi:3,4-dihydroxy 2-butanone 4-phosphate synthase/GTP cyclohydrolase II